MDPVTMGLLMGGTSLLSGIMGSSSAKRAARIQQEAAREAAAAQLQAAREAQQLTRDVYGANVGLMGEAGREAVAMQEPYAQAGRQTLGLLMSGLGYDPVAMAGKLSEEFTGQDIYKDPSYQFRLQEGMRALRAQQAAGGNRFSGQAMKDIQNYAQQAASQEYGSAYDRFMKNREALYTRLSGVSALGQQAAAEAGRLRTGTAGTTAELGARMAGDVAGLGTRGQTAASDYLTSGAAARAAGQVGSTQAIIGAPQQMLENYITMSYLNRLPGQGAMATPGIKPIPMLGSGNLRA